MSEEKPTFKVTDRRLFNADGTPRADIPREEEKPAAAPTAAADPPADATAGRGAAGREAAGREAGGPPFADESSFMDELGALPGEAGEPPFASGVDEGGRRGGPGGAESADPTPFANLVMFIAQPAAASMGMTEHPGLAPGEVDLPLAKHCIDLLATVREKSRGNLSQQEQQIVDGLLSELRMQYVSLTSAPRPPQPPRGGFTGGDITGGR